MTYSDDLMKITVNMPMKSNIAEDAVMIDLHYISPPARLAADYDNFMDHLIDFFNTASAGGTGPLNQWFGDELSQTTDAVTVRFYDVPPAGGLLGSPVEVRQMRIANSGVGTLPEEVSSCLSFRTDYGAAVEFGAGTRPRSRLRNRIYLPPLCTLARDQDGTTKRVKVKAGLIQDAMASAIEFLYTAQFGDSWLWRTVSKTAVQDHPVTYVEMDNAFDTQRRRGPAPTARAEAPVV